MRRKLSIVIPTKNEAKNIVECLKRVSPVADEIIVVDSYSTDKTIMLARRFGAKVFMKKSGDFSSIKNFGLEKSTGKWILQIDADEFITPALADSIRKLVSKDSCDAVWIYRQNYFLGKHVFDSYELKLFRRHFRFSGEVHERIETRPTDKICRLPRDKFIEHKSSECLAAVLAKTRRYTDLEVGALMKESPSSFKVALLFLMDPLKYFFGLLFARRCLLSFGGIAFAASAYYYMILKYVKYLSRYSLFGRKT